MIDDVPDPACPDPFTCSGCSSCNPSAHARPRWTSTERRGEGDIMIACDGGAPLVFVRERVGAIPAIEHAAAIDLAGRLVRHLNSERPSDVAAQRAEAEHLRGVDRATIAAQREAIATLTRERDEAVAKWNEADALRRARAEGRREMRERVVKRLREERTRHTVLSDGWHTLGGAVGTVRALPIEDEVPNG